MDLVSRFAHARALARMEPKPAQPEPLPSPVSVEAQQPSEPDKPVQPASFAMGSLRARLERHAPLPKAARLASAQVSVQIAGQAPGGTRAAQQVYERARSAAPFERRVHSVALVRRGERPRLLGACLDRLELPDTTRLARDLVCLGAKCGARPAIIDLESTGLRGAAVPFVIGVAWIEEQRVEVVQWILRRIGGEAQMLNDVFAELRRRGADPLVSFNGASFDLPLLRLRAARHGLGASEISESVDHMDLLHPARRLYRGQWNDCRLGTLERGLLGLRRQGDIDGAEIPAVFWDYVRLAETPPGPAHERAHARMQAVVEHNLVDLVSLPALAGRLADQLRSPDSLERARRAARHWQRVGAEGQARRVLDRWVEPGLASAGRRDRRRGPKSNWRAAALELASLERRARGLPRAARLWEAAWADDPGCPSACDAWAKYLEHHAGDFARALEVAGGSRLPCPRRIARLERRLARARAQLNDSQNQVEVREQSSAPQPATLEVPVRPQSHASVDRATQGSAKPCAVTPRPASDEAQRSRGTELSGRARADASLLRSVEDETGVRRRYRLLR